MDPLVEVSVFLILPYAATAAFVVGCLYNLGRWFSARRTTGLRSVAVVPNTFGSGAVLWDLIKRVFWFYTLPKMEKDRTLIVGGLMFHYGIVIVLVSHLGLVVPLPISSGLHMWLGFWIGGTAGLLALAGIVVLLVRRLALPRMRQISTFDDYFSSGLLITIIAFGLVQTLIIQPDYMNTVSPWLVSILSLAPNLSPIAGVGFFTIAHVIVTMLFFAYLPYGKMVHLVGYLFNPTVTGPSFQVGMENLRPLPGLIHNGGGGGE